MNEPAVIYMQEPSKQRTEKQYDNDIAYYSEETVRTNLAKAYEHAAWLNGEGPAMASEYGRKRAEATIEKMKAQAHDTPRKDS